jgi:DNA-binding response OmpR family regulator
MRVLVIDDNKEIADVMRFYGDSSGIECITTNNGKEGTKNC